ncbi:MAG: hydrolase [Enterovirga sp.]|nr:hydrolase [Enterovirga sp.]
MSDARAERLTEYVSNVARERRWPNQKPKNAATLIIIDRRAKSPKVLMGKRHPGHKFMPSKFVFPGGRLESDDRKMPALGSLAPEIEAALIARTVRPSPSRGRALALTAIRETFEETGLMIGRPADPLPAAPSSDAWAPFFERGILPDLGAVHFVGRAITPPRRPKRFDTRFFAIDREAIALEVPGFVGPDKELVELAWVELDEARQLDLPAITVVMLEELERRTEGGFGHALPVPFYHERQKRFVRELLGAA